MASFLEVANGRDAGSTLVIHDGQLVRAGRRWGLELTVDDDPDLPEIAFAINGHAHHAELFPLAGSILRNGEPIGNVPLHHGDWLLCGRTLIRHTRSEVTTYSGTPETPLDWLGVQLLARPDYLLWLDLADHVPLRRRLESSCPCLPWAQSIPEERALGAAPWLVAPGLRPALLQELLHEFWSTQRMQILWSPAAIEPTLQAYRQCSPFRDWQGEVVTLRFWDPRFWHLLHAEGESPAPLAGLAHELWMPAALPAELCRWQHSSGELQPTRQWIGWEDRRLLALWEIEATLLRSGLPFLSTAHALLPPGFEVEATLRRAASLGFSSPAAAIQYALLTARYGKPPEQLSAVQQATRRLGVPLPAAMDHFVLAINRRAGQA